MMRRRFFAALVALLIAAPVSAQITITPSSGVSGSGALTSGPCLTFPLSTQECEEAANTLAIRNLANAQTLRIYNTTDSTTTNYERGALFFSGNEFKLSTELGGTGLGRNIGIQPAGVINFRPAGSLAWQMGLTGHFLPTTDNTFDIGVVATNRVRNIYAQNFIGGGASLTGIAGATGGISNIVNTNIVADSDNNGSGVIDFTTGIVSKWQVVNAGHLQAQGAFQLQAADGTAAAPSLSFASATNKGIHGAVAGGVTVSVAASNVGVFAGTGLNLGTLALGFAGGDPGVTSMDTILIRDAANSLALRNTANAQRFSIYNTYTSAVNNESFSVDWQTFPTQSIVGNRTAATGSPRAMLVATQHTNASNLYAGMLAGTNNDPRVRLGLMDQSGAAVNSAATGTNVQLGAWTNTATSGSVISVAVTPSYNQVAATTANTDLLINRTQTSVGSGAQRLIDAQVGGVSQFSVSNVGVITAAGDISAIGGSMTIAAGGVYGWNGRGFIFAQADGVFRLSNNALTDFGRLQFGGTTNAFPSLKRSGTAINVRLADDSADAPLIAGNLLSSAGALIGFVGRSALTSSADGILTMTNNALNDFTRLNFGGTTAAFPAVVREGTGIAVKLADNSAYGGLALSNQIFTSAGAAAVNVNASSDGVLKLTDSAGTSFNRLQLGGTTNAFPAIRRTSTSLEAVLADNSDFAPVAGFSFAARPAGANAASAGDIRLPHAGVGVRARNAGNSADLALLTVGLEENDGTRLGNNSGNTRIRSFLATPTNLTDGDWWVDCTGVSPARVCAIKVRDGGGTRTIASLTY